MEAEYSAVSLFKVATSEKVYKHLAVKQNKTNEQ